MQDQPVAYREGWELLKEAADAVIAVSDEEWEAKKAEVTRKFWEQVRARLEEALPEEREPDVLWAVLQAELRINSDSFAISLWSTRMLVDRADEEWLRHLVDEVGAGAWRLVGVRPHLRIFCSELADMMEELNRINMVSGPDGPAYHRQLQRVKDCMTRHMLNQAFARVSAEASSVEWAARSVFLAPGMPAQRGGFDPELVFGPEQPEGDEDLPEHVGTILQPFVGIGLPGAPSGSIVLDLVNGVIGLEEARQQFRDNRQRAREYFAAQAPPDTLEAPTRGEDSYSEDDNVSKGAGRS